MVIGRFAPSTTGEAHPGTLLAGLIAWLSAKSAGGRCLLRLEDLDPERSNRHLAQKMVEDLAWFGLTFDATVWQSTLWAQHAAALDRLAAQGLLYACTCSRARIARTGRQLADGSRIYANTCRGTGALTAADWRQTSEAVRVRLDGVACDPVVRRRDGSVAYLLACVVDDAAMGITHVVRGRDLADQEGAQRALGEALGLPIPDYRHHLLLLEPHGGKLAKMHGSLPISRLRELAPAGVWVGALAHLAGLQKSDAPVMPARLVTCFDWSALRQSDCTVVLADNRLERLDDFRLDSPA
jgi:glutamyl/glutaminyl-tRNA synthetase